MHHRRPLHRRLAPARALPVLALGALLAGCGSPSTAPHGPGSAPAAVAPADAPSTAATAAASATAPASAGAPAVGATATPSGRTTAPPGHAGTPAPAAASPVATSTPRSSGGGTNAASGGSTSGSAAPPATSALGWNLVVYYTPVETYYSGATQSITGCGPDAPDTCGDTTPGTTALGSYPTSFLDAVQNIDDGKITSGPYAGDYLVYDDPGWTIDTTLTDSNDNPMVPFGTAEADVPVGTHFQVTGCGTQGGAAVPSSICSQLIAGRWTVTDSNEGNTASEVDLYIGMENSPSFAASALATVKSAGAHTTLPAPIANDNN